MESFKMPSVEGPHKKIEGDEDLASFVRQESDSLGSSEDAGESIEGLPEAFASITETVGELVKDKEKAAKIEQTLAKKDQAI